MGGGERGLWSGGLTGRGSLAGWRRRKLINVKEEDGGSVTGRRVMKKSLGGGKKRAKNFAAQMTRQSLCPILGPGVL